MKGHNRSLGVVVILVLLTLVLSGCIHVRQEITLKSDENWQAHSLITFPAEVVSQLGEEELGSNQEDFEAQRQEAEKKGVKATFETRKEGNGDMVFDMGMEGQGLALLNESVFENAATFAVGDDGRVTFRYDAGEITSLTSMGGSYIFVLKAGQIHSSNATKVEGNTATWENPATAMEAVVSLGGAGGGGSAWWIILVVIGVIAALAVGAFLLYQRGKRLQAPVETPPAPLAPPEVLAQPAPLNVPEVPAPPAPLEVPAPPDAPAPPEEPLS